MTSITTHLNRPIRSKEKGEEITIHDLIINIPIPDDNLDHLQLFRSVDIVNDTSKIWLNGRRGAGGPGLIVTFMIGSKLKL